jgi:hypothetical protein
MEKDSSRIVKGLDSTNSATTGLDPLSIINPTAESKTGWPDWANFCLLDNCILWALQKLPIHKNWITFFPRKKVVYFFNKNALGFILGLFHTHLVNLLKNGVVRRQGAGLTKWILHNIPPRIFHFTTGFDRLAWQRGLTNRRSWVCIPTLI